METGQIESVSEIIECVGYNGGTESWPNISGANLTGPIDVLFGGKKKYSYTFNNLWSKKVSFSLELIGREFKSLDWFKIIKITTKI
jgi:hypothetical protein